MWEFHFETLFFFLTKTENVRYTLKYKKIQNNADRFPKKSYKEGGIWL